jgi:hypothetical protein
MPVRLIYTGIDPKLVRLVQRIQELTLELQRPRRRDLDHADLEDKERSLEHCADDSPHEMSQPTSSATLHDDRGGSLDRLTRHGRLSRCLSARHSLAPRRPLRNGT